MQPRFTTEAEFHETWGGEERFGLLNNFSQAEERSYPTPLVHADMHLMYEPSMHAQDRFAGSQNEFQESHIQYPESSQRTVLQCESSSDGYSAQHAPHANDDLECVTGGSLNSSRTSDFSSSRREFPSRFGAQVPMYVPVENAVLWGPEPGPSDIYARGTIHHYVNSAPETLPDPVSSWPYHRYHNHIVLSYESTDLQRSRSPENVPATTVTAASIPMREGSEWFSVQQSSGGASDAVYPQHIMHEQTAHVLPTTTTSLDRALDESGLTSGIETPIKTDYGSDDMGVGQTVGIAKKKKKSKMHACEICHKLFPRPSGLKTHMNTHNNVKPFPCTFPGCNRSFTVRSNAKRHLRTHGVTPESFMPSSPDYVVNFDAPVVPDSEGHPLSSLPAKLKWMPTSLLDRNNVTTLRSISEDGEESDSDSDELEDDPAIRRPTQTLPIPLPPVTPSTVDDDNMDGQWYEDRNSFAEVGAYPYHPSQVKHSPN
ncbi:c2h2 conidiation transcription factor [Moniliophthora roreri MCA 2997]|uniref:C2h2 conidiation transcription factor n=1 Tax=Moniliophthora roreri (strain MCA 2997) TaxID=1381753 RepID=V2WNC8_MONRO|nr:c2h2 conidiation transcription factor [Moniliophthora roreri MCA 2997]